MTKAAFSGPAEKEGWRYFLIGKSADTAESAKWIYAPNMVQAFSTAKQGKTALTCYRSVKEKP